MDEKEIRVLIVDDEKVIRKSLVYFFEDEGFEVYSAGSAAEALDILSNCPVSVGIFDMQMPDMDGHQLINKAHNIRPAMKYIVHTGSHDYQLPPDLLLLGITPSDVFTKPVPDVIVLVEHVRALF